MKGSSPRGKGQKRFQQLAPQANAKFVEYYKDVLQLNPSEMQTMIDSLLTPLPTTFRISEGCPFTEQLRAELRTFAGATVEVEDMTVHPCELLEWYPGNRAYKLGCDKRLLKKTEALA
eukprot:CAMPEP_0118952796 /NCGR_PEP_ID=MMETSP1169-20130426/55488_1 /TAXON_ID=36882 /ORGANISM="Pyramimonas obovata, Strain CCMP722" /LENGTH=117 /DNA_ID=CAMNT_0006900127 /DNA_START=233 /DNA_END=582 /DNA_ORIENTATION=-